MPRRNRPKPTETELVRINGERVKEGLATADNGEKLSHREAGKRLAKWRYGNTWKPGEAEKSLAVRLDNILKGQQTCARYLRRGLAELLDLPESWLSGELESLPYTFDGDGVNPAPAASAEVEVYRRYIVMQMMISNLQDRGRRLPSRRQVAEYRFWRKADPILRGIATHDSARAIGYVMCLRNLTSPSFWRGNLLTFNASVTLEDVDAVRAPYGLSHREGGEPIEESEAREALVKAFTHFLEPWFAGRAELNLPFLARVTDLNKTLDLADMPDAEFDAMIAADLNVTPDALLARRKGKRGRT